ncbi:MAG: ABC transporter permease [Phycisphaerae bacterium]|nr:ABC transporter permease [Phycisphaerae bacterium]
MVDASERHGGFGKVVSVAWREFKHTALTKAFVFGAVILPILIWGVMALSALFVSREPPPLTGTFAIIDPSGLVIAEAEKGFRREAERRREGVANVGAAVKAMSEGDANAAMALTDTRGVVEITVRGVSDPAAADSLREEVRDNKLLGMAEIDPKILSADHGNTPLKMLVQTNSSPKHTDLYERIVRDAAVRARVANTGGDYESMQTMLQRPPLNTERIARGGGVAKDRGDLRMLVPIAFMMLLWISTFTSGQYLLTTTIEEKSNKVMEVLLSAVSPMQLLAGKILGQAAVSTVILVLYGGAAFSLLAGLALADLIQPSLIVYLVLYYIMAYFLIATIMAAIGSAVSDLREAQALVTPAMLVLILPMVLIVPITDSPNGTLATVTSFIPPAIPFVMMLRLGGPEPIAFWQIALSMVIGFGSMFGLLWVGARIFRVGVLMQGKPPTPLELARWAMYR